MGFPDTGYALLEPAEGESREHSIFQHYRMLGNAVCPPVICILGGAILAHLKVGCNAQESGKKDPVEREGGDCSGNPGVNYQANPGLSHPTQQCSPLD